MATELGLPLISKDTIKEALFDSLGTGDLDRSHQSEEVTAGWRSVEPVPLALGCPLIEVDTTAPVDVDALAAKVRQAAV